MSAEGAVGGRSSFMSESSPAGTAAESPFQLAPLTRSAPCWKPPSVLAPFIVPSALARSTMTAAAPHLAGAEETARTFLTAWAAAGAMTMPDEKDVPQAVDTSSGGQARHVQAFFPLRATATMSVKARPFNQSEASVSAKTPVNQ